jgi:hypothetical protein
MGLQRLSPIHSDHEDDDALRERIDAFVLGLGEWVDALQDAHASGELSRVEGLAADHGREAHALGYPVLADATDEIVASCRASDAEAARKGIGDVTELIQRVRLGHRSAA